MNTVEHIPPVNLSPPRNWRNYLFDTLIAVAGSLLVTAFIGYSHLYPRITTITMIYLLLIVLLAIFRSRYAAIFCSCFTFVAVDYFLVPPIFQLSIEQLSQFFALLVFLAIALVTSQLTGMLRRHADFARDSEHKLRVLYELLRVYSSTNDVQQRLDTIALSTARVFAPWGVVCCAILLPDARHTLEVRADAPITVEAVVLSDAEKEAAQGVLRSGQCASLLAGQSQDFRATTEKRSNTARQRSVPATSATKSMPTNVVIAHLLPLHERDRTFGVLYLRVRDGLLWLDSEETMQRALLQYSPQVTFFWSYIEQITVLIDRALVQVDRLEETKHSH